MGLMKCRNCGKKGLANIQAIRAHLRFCPSRPDSQQENVEHPEAERRGRRGTSSIVRYQDIPVPAVPWVSELESTGIDIGVPPRVARTTANYLAMNFTLDDPLSMWNLMRDCPELAPARGRQWLRTWCTIRGIRLEPWQELEMGWDQI